MKADPADPALKSDTRALFSPERLRRRRVSDLAGPAWRRLLSVVAACLVAAVANRLWGVDRPLAAWSVLLPLAYAWLSAVRFLLLDSAGRRFWTVWLGCAVLALLLAGRSATGLYVAVPLSFVFLVCRRYRPYGHLGSWRRAAAFGLGLVALAGLVVGWFFGTGEEPPGRWHGLGVNLARYALASLQIFWVLSLLRLFLGMRLHFLRLKPKLAVSALFIALVPLILFACFWLLALYGSLGGMEATRGRDVLHHWARLVDGGARFAGAPFAETFRYRAARDPDPEDAARPAWLADFLAALADSARAAVTPPPAAGAAEDSTGRAAAGARGATVRLDDDGRRARLGARWSPADTTAYFRWHDRIWLLRLRGVGSERFELEGYRVDGGALDSLSALLGADASLYSSRGLMIGDPSDPQVQAAQEDSTRGTLHIQGRMPGAAAPDSLAGAWQRRLHYGGAVLGVIRLAPDGFYHDDVLLHLKIALADLARTFVLGENEFNQALVAALAVVAVLFLFIQVFALFFGLRIATGITSAVKLLHRGTRRLAAGDLTTRIEVPNEDELGDLAASFNEMAAAVARGREEAVARERLERELATAREIQERLLPHDVPEVPGFEVTGTSVPSRQVGGDYFDFLDQPDGRLGIAIGDVSGKGMPAALLMSNLQASLQGQVIHPSSVAEVVGRVNDLLVRSTDPHMFATFFYGVLDRESGAFAYTNAGHNPPLLCRADGSLEELRTGGLLLGMLPGQDYEQATVELRPGDAVVLYTDGITEAVGPAAAGDAAAAPDGDEADEDESLDNMFGEEALAAVVTAGVAGGAAEIKEAILSAVGRHTAGTPQSDDITLVVLKRRPA